MGRSALSARFDDALRALQDEALNNQILHSLLGHVGHSVSIMEARVLIGRDEDYAVTLRCDDCETDLLNASD